MAKREYRTSVKKRRTRNTPEAELLRKLQDKRSVARPPKKWKEAKRRPAPGKALRGPIPIKIDWGVVEEMASQGCKMEEIAAEVGITPEGLGQRPECYAALNKGFQKYKVKIRQAQNDVGLKLKNPTMLIFLGKNVLGQTDRVEQFLSGPDGGPVPIANVDLSRLSLDQLVEFRSMLKQISSPGDGEEGNGQIIDLDLIPPKQLNATQPRGRGRKPAGKK